MRNEVAVKNELRLSLYLDGRLPAEEAARIEADPSLREQIEAMRRLQRLSEELALTEGGFTSDDLLVRAGHAKRAWHRYGLWAAAALVIAVTHGGAFLLGTRRAPERVDPTSSFMERAAEIDPAAPPDRLRGQLIALRDELPQRLATARGVRADALTQMEVAFDQFEDPGFLGIVVSGIAREVMSGSISIRFLPVSAQRYVRLTPLEGGRMRLQLVDASGARPLVVSDDGTLEELRLRHPQVQFIEGEK